MVHISFHGNPELNKRCPFNDAALTNHLTSSSLPHESEILFACRLQNVRIARFPQSLCGNKVSA